MEEDDEEVTPLASKASSTMTLVQQCSMSNSLTSVAEQTSGDTYPQFQLVTHQASEGSLESEDSSHRFSSSPRYSPLISKSPHSSSSQEDYDLPHKGQFLTAGRTETARSMESLRIMSR